jgi:hypothetical protein
MPFYQRWALRGRPRELSSLELRNLGGLGLTHLAEMQGHTRLKYLLGHLRCGDTTGRLMQILLEYTQLECGCRGNPLAQDYNNYSTLLINTN